MNESNLPPGCSPSDPHFNPPEGDFKDCHKCYGTGETPDSTTYDCEPIPCKHCDGEGVIEIFPEDREETAGDELADARREPDWPRK